MRKNLIYKLKEMWNKIKQVWINETKQEIKDINTVIFILLENESIPIMEGYDKYYNPILWNYYKQCKIIKLNYVITLKDETIIKQDVIDFKNNTKALNTLLEILNSFNVDTIVCYDYKYTINILLAHCYYNKSSYLIKKLKTLNDECIVTLSKLKFHKKYQLEQLYNMLNKNENQSYNSVNLCKKCYFALKKI